MHSKTRFIVLALASLSLIVLASSTALATSPAASAAATPLAGAKVSAVLAHQEAVLDRLGVLTPKLAARVAAIPAGPRHTRALTRLDAFKARVASAQAAHDRLMGLAVGGISLAQRPAARRGVADFRINVDLARVNALLIRWF